MPNPTIVVAHLNDDELIDSIDKLVNYVGNKTTVMAGQFTKAMDLMKDSMKDFAITQKVSVDLMKQAWREMSSSFDAMVQAQSGATGGGTGKPKVYADNTVGALEQEISLRVKDRKEMELGSAELREQNRLIDERKRKLKEETTSMANRWTDKALQMPTGSLDEANRKLKILEYLQKRYANSTEISAAKQQKVANAIERTRKAIDTLRPKSLKEVLGMDESSVDAIAKKMRALKFVSINPQNAAEVNKLGSEYQRLSRLQATLLGKNIQLTHSNNYLAQSFGYIRNRIVYALTLGAITNFTKQIYEVRGQYELLERSLGILIDNMRRGSEIFNELNAMALKSPFTLMELATGAKQLMAYNFAEDEVVDTTRRLADISSALGVPMERLVYNLGQIRAQTVLNARDARDFANAGLAIVPMLAELYTKQKKFGDEIVTTAQVYDMMSKKMVSYADVMKVINSITDEGGKFYNFQAKQAETMIVQMNNLKLSWNNMLNEIGKDNQNLLTMPLKGLKMLFENWQQLVKVIKGAIVAMGLYYTRATLVSLINGTLITQGSIRAGFLLAKSFYAAKDALAALRTVVLTNPLGLLATGIAVAVGYMALFNDRIDETTTYTERFGKDGGKVVRDVESLYGALESLDNGTSTYKKVLGELNQILGDFNLKQIDETAGIDAVIKSREKNIQLIKEEILERKHLNDLEQGKTEYDDAIENARKRLRSNLSNAITENFFGIGTINDEIAKNAPALTNIISDIIESNINLVANKTGKEYEKGVERIFAIIQDRLRNNKALGLSEDVINSSWLENNFFRFYKSNIIKNVINDLKEAKEANDAYNESVNENYEAEKKAAKEGANFNDRVEQTSTALLNAANDTDKFYGKINKLIKDYSGQNIIDFLVRVNAQVPKWMLSKSTKELSELAAKFTAIAQNGGRAKGYTNEQTAIQGALYAEALRQKQLNIEANKSTTITNEASKALNDYKKALEAEHVAQNLVNRGKKEASFLTEKQKETQDAYNKALEKGVSLEELRKAKNGGKSGGKGKDPLGDALTKEVQLITDIQRLYKEYKKEGVDAFSAASKAAHEYNKSLATQNATLSKFGIKGLTGEQLATMNLRQVREYYQGMLDIATKLKNVKGVEVLEKAIRGLNEEITKIDYKHITEGLNNELSKLKDEYELAVELNANPELGGMFAEMFDIDLDMLPKNAEEYADRYTKYLNKYLKAKGSELELPNLLNLTKWDMDAFKEQMESDDLNKEWYDAILKGYLATRDARKKETSDTIKEYNKLLEKYAEYEYKVSEIQKNAEREREVARKRGASQEILDAIDNRERQELAKLAFEEFQKSPEWIVATGDLAGMTDKAIGGLIKSIEDYKKKAKDLNPKQIKQINRALTSLYKQQRQGNPFKAISNAMLEAKNRAAEFTPAIEEAEKELNKLENGKRDQGRLAETADRIGELREKIKKLKEEQKKEGKVSASTIVEGINSAIQAAQQATSVFTDMMSALGNKKAVEDIDRVFSVLDKAGQGALVGARIGGGYGAAIGAVAGGLSGAISAWADVWSGNAAITESVKESERAVRSLQRAYKDLEDVIEHAAGTAVISMKKAAAANRELQLTELKRQLQLELSRKSKNQDDDRIAELRDEIKDLEIEIKNATEDIVNDLLGISSIGDAAESMMDAFVEALRNGEDAMAGFNESVDDMIANMLKKMLVSKILMPRIQAIFDDIQAKVDKRTQDEASEIANAQALISDIWSDGVSTIEDIQRGGWGALLHEFANDDPFGDADQFLKNIKGSDWAKRYKEETGMDATAWSSDGLSGEYKERVTEEFEKWFAQAYYDALNNQIRSLRNEIDSSWTVDDIKDASEELNQLKPLMQGSVDYVNTLIEELGLMKTSNKALSALQQGIQGITEDTAGALEAYMNGVSQQVYYHSTLLEQIRDAVVGFTNDANLGIQAQMLLQLQTNYNVMMMMQGMMEGWTVPSGNGIRVELMN